MQYFENDGYNSDYFNKSFYINFCSLGRWFLLSLLGILNHTMFIQYLISKVRGILEVNFFIPG